MNLLRWKRKGRKQEKIIDENCFMISAFQIYTSYSTSLYASIWIMVSVEDILVRMGFLSPTLTNIPVIYKTPICHVLPVAEKPSVMSGMRILLLFFFFLNKYLLALKRFRSTFIFA